MVDEFSDDEGRYVVDIMVVIFDFDYLFQSGRFVVYLFDMQFLSEINNKIVFQVVVLIVNEFNIDFDNFCVFNSDNVFYMKKVLNDIYLIFFYQLFLFYVIVILLR